MSVLYVTEQGSSISKRGQRLVVEKEGKELLEIKCFKIRSLLLFGNVQFSTQAARQMLNSGIEMSMLTMKGELVGHLAPPSSRNVPLRITQVNRLNDHEFMLQTARAIVGAKVANSRAVIKEFHSNHPDVPLQEHLDSLKQTLGKVSSAESDDQLLGFEGNAASVYWKAFSQMCRGELTFEKRQKRPPKDPVNSLLSLGYSVAFARIQGVLGASGLDPYVGFFHKPHYGRPSLACDLLEEFRAPLVDKLTLKIVNKKIMNAEHFCFHEETGGIRMTKEGLSLYLKQFEDFFGKSSTRSDEPQPDFKQLITTQVDRLTKSIELREPYEPFMVKRRRGG